MADKTFVLKNSTSLTQQVFCWDDDVDFGGGTAWTQNLSDTITFSDSLGSKAVGLVKADTITFSDNMSRVWTALMTLADTITFSDTISNAYSKVLADIITFSDSTAKAVTTLFADTITFSDAAIRGMGKSLSDTITFSDSAIRGIGKILSDTITFSDSITDVVFNTLRGLPEIIATVARKAFGITRSEKPQGMTKHTDKTDIV